MKRIMTWSLSALLALAFFAAGVFKLTGPQNEVDMFATFGLPLWTMYAVALLEIISAVGLLLPRYAGLAAALLAVDMIGALGLHLLHGQMQMAIAPLVLGVLCAIVLSLRGGLRRLQDPVMA